MKQGDKIMNKRQRLIAFVGIALTLIFILSIRNGGFLGASRLKGDLQLTQIKDIPILIEKDTSHKKFLDGIIQYADGELYYFDYLGDKKWSVSLDIKHPIIKTSQESVYLFDSSRNQLVRIDSKGKVAYRYTIEGEMKNFSLAEYDDAALIHEESENKSMQVNLVEKNGRKRTGISLTEGFILNMTPSIQNDIIAVGILDTTGKEATSHVLYYNLKGKLVNSVNLGTTIIYNMYFGKDDNLIVVSDTKVYGLSRERIKWEVEMDGLSTFELIDKSSIVLYGKQNKSKGTSKGEDSILIIQGDGKLIEAESLSEQILGMDTFNRDMVAYSKRSIFILGNKGEIIYSQKYHKDIEKVYLYDSGYLVIRTKENVYFNKLEKK